MKRNQSTLFKSTLGALTALCVLLPGVSHAAPDGSGNIPIATSPLFLSYSAEPNIMFIQDDSGSMHWEVMPDSYNYAYFVIPRVNDVYDSNDFANTVPVFDDTKGYSVGMRSSDVNAIYYNPEITYTPWAKFDGQLYDDASPTAAYYNPERTWVGTIDLTNTNTMSAQWRSCDKPPTLGGTCTSAWSSETFYPSVYYRYDGDGDIWDPGNFEEVVIKNDAGETYSDDDGLTDRSGRDDCAAATSCTGIEEMQNFANWFTYYRSRVLLGRAGVGRAFSEQGTNLRVGFGAINSGTRTVDGASFDTIIDGVRKFEGGDREDWFDRLYEYEIWGSTPLRTALKDAGLYYSRQNSTQSAWDETPGDNSDATNEIACRQSYTILMSDGFWNGGSPSVGNVDNTNGSSITNPNGVDYSYVAEPPYKDAHSDTLADVAMYFWNRDLNTVLDNKVPQNPLDEAYWQHMVTFTVGLGVTGTLDYTDPDVLQDLIDGTESWPAPSNNSQNNIDDMWHAAINGRGDFFSAADPGEFAQALTDTLTNIADRTGSAAAVATNSTRISSETRIYQARFNSRNWTGELFAYPIDKDGSVLFTDPSVWEAGAVLDARTSPVSTRKIFTTKADSSAVAFDWSNFDADDKSRILGATYGGTTPEDTLGDAIIDYLLGDKSNEGANGGAFRNRDSLLGDIINSDPLYVGIANYAYTVLPEGGTDTDSNGVLDYNDYLINQEAKNSGAGRTPVLYVGGNSGMLHAFNAENGNEMFGYVPNAVYDNLADLADPSYNHKFYVDGSPKANDAFLANTWKTVLVASTGSGGNSVFALDVTDPGTDASVTFDTSDVLWEIVGDPTSADANLKELGTTIGQPTIVRLEEPYTTPSGTNPGWYAIFGNGYNSATGTARLFVVELETGNIAKVIDTEAGSFTVGSDTYKNGLATVSPIDIDGDRITDHVYAGDLAGNMWRFDMTGNSADSDLVWDVAYIKSGVKKPLFQATDSANGAPQPITIRPQVGRNPEGGTMVYFGTGKYLENDDNVVPNSPQIQSFYGIKDPFPNNANSMPVDRGDLLEQTIDYEQSGQTVDYRVTSENAMGNNDDGWYLDLAPPPDNDAGVGERVIANPVLRYDRIIFTTAIPSADPCDYGGSGWLMELSALYGTRLSYAVIDVNGDGLINDLDVINDGNDDYFVSGKRLDGIGEPGAIISAGDKEYKYISTSTGTINVTTEAGGGSQFARQSWRRLQ